MESEKTGGRTSAGTELEFVLRLSQFSRNISLGDLAEYDPDESVLGTPKSSQDHRQSCPSKDEVGNV